MESNSDSGFLGDTLSRKGDACDSDQPVYRIIQVDSAEMDAVCGVGPAANGVAYLAAAANLIRQTDAESNNLMNTIVPRAIKTVTIAASGDTVSGNSSIHNNSSTSNNRVSETDSEDSNNSVYRNTASSGSNVEYDGISAHQSQLNSKTSSNYSQGRINESYTNQNAVYASNIAGNSGVLPVGPVAQIGSQLYVVMPAGSHDFSRLITTTGTSSAAASNSIGNNLAANVAVKQERRSSVTSPHDVGGAMHTLAVAAAYQTRDDKRRATHNEVERRRRDKINTWIRELALVVPPASNALAASSSTTTGYDSKSAFGGNNNSSSASTSGAHSKGDVLSRACEYIRDLERANQRLRHDSQFEIDSLRRENELLKQELRKHGIALPPMPPPLSINKSNSDVILDVCSSDNVAAMVTVSNDYDSQLSANSHATVGSINRYSRVAKRSRNGDYSSNRMSAGAILRENNPCDDASSPSSDSDTLALPSAASLNVQLQSLPD